MSPLESVLRRDRLVVAAGLLAVTLVAWAYMAYEASAMYRTGVCCCVGMKMSGPDLQPWSTATLLPLFLMWGAFYAGFGALWLVRIRAEIWRRRAQALAVQGAR